MGTSAGFPGVCVQGEGVVLMGGEGLAEGAFVGEYLGELYTPWRWLEREEKRGAWSVQEPPHKLSSQVGPVSYGRPLHWCSSQVFINDPAVLIRTGWA